jgi:hypothetical protein
MGAYIFRFALERGHCLTASALGAPQDLIYVARGAPRQI